MAKKRQISQLDDPPTPAPKDDPPPSPETPVEDKVVADEEEDDDSTSSGEEEEEEEDSSSEGEDEEEKQNQKTPSTQPAPKNTPPPSSNSKPKSPPSSEGESESESESDSEPISKSTPLPSKPSKSQPQSSAAAAAARSGTKRPVENDTKPSPSKKKKTIAADVAKEPEEAKKLFQRVFNDEDELAILKGAVEFIAKTGNDPYKYVTAFYETVKKAIHVEITLEQLKDKMRRLKLKFENKMKSVKNGKKPTFKKPIEEKMFELSQKIWGDDKVHFNETEEKGKPNGKGVKKESAVKKPPTFKKEPDSPLVVFKETRKVESSVEKDVPGANLMLNEMVGSNGLNVVAMKRGLELLEESKKEEMEARWKKLQISELELFVERAELVEDTARCILDALKSSSS